MNYKEIGIRIQLAREQSGLNQKELADMLGISQSTLSNYEKGKRKLYLAQLQLLAEALGKPLDYFLQPVFEQDTPGPPLPVHPDITREGSDFDEVMEIMNDLRSLNQEDRRLAAEFVRWLKSRR